MPDICKCEECWKKELCEVYQNGDADSWGCLLFEKEKE